ncbi:synaptic vesicular amine transporter-like [Watersipora subatra]|uniref:synaptic vesicular amine transporter-like n=1 Tax=Watersipora subatra TaxID=2589382 RepID=UPI00355B1270
MEYLPSWRDIPKKAGEFKNRTKQSFTDFSFKEFWRNFRSSNRMLVLVVFIAIYIDNMLTTTVVPVIPDFLFAQEHPEDYQRVRGKLNTPGSVQFCEEIERNASDYGAFNTTQSNLVVEHSLYENNCTNQTIAPEVMKKRSEDLLRNQSTKIGLLFASKSAVQLLTNPIIGPLTNRVGFSIPMFTGFIVIFTSTLVFAFGKSYVVLLIARAVQGAGSSCTTVSGMGLIAEKYTDDRERGNAMAVALSGLALGVLIGPTFGGLLYDFIGKAAPFLFLAALALIDGGLQIYVMKPERTPEQQKGASMLELLRDPYILLAAGAITFANMGIGMLEPTLPTFMLQTMNSKKWEQGIAFLPASVSYMLGTIIFGPVALKMGRWRAAMIGMLLIAVALFVIPFSKCLAHLIAPNLCLGLAIGMVDSAMMPTMAYLVDLRHISIYGSVYAIADVAFCLGFAVGPAVGGVIVETIGFKWMLWIISITNLMYAPLLYFLQNPPGNNEKMQLVLNDKCPIKYVTYKQSEGADQDSETGIDEAIYTEHMELQIDEYSSNGKQLTHLTNYVRKPVGNSVVPQSDSESSDTEGADSPDSDGSSDSEHSPR